MPGIFSKVLSKLKSVFRKTKEQMGCTKEDVTKDVSFRDTLEDFIEEESSIESDEREILGNVLELRSLTASDIMVPRAEIVAVQIDMSKEDILKVFIQSKVSNVLVFQNTLDNILGRLNVKDVISADSFKDNIKDIIKPVLFISPSMRNLDLLLQMKEAKNKIAVVVDEYGGVDGIVTFSQLVEEVVGDIREEEARPIQNSDQCSIIVDARTKIDDLEKVLGITMIDAESADAETLGGLVVWLAGYVPERGACIMHPLGPKFEILESDPRRVRLVAVYPLKQEFSHK